MIAAVALLTFAVLAVGSAAALSSAHWPSRSPAVAIWAWQCLSGAAAFAVVLAGLAIALPETPFSGTVAGVVGVDTSALARHYSAPGGGPVAVVALAVSAGVVIRFGYFLARDRWSAWRARRHQRATLNVIAPDQPGGYKLLPHNVPMVYCVPGPRPSIVVTQGAVNVLTSHQLGLVLAHERRHLKARHDLALALSEALSRTFGNTGLFRQAHEQIAALAEMQADDSATRSDDRRELAEALIRLSPHGDYLNAGLTPAPGAVPIRGGGAARVVRLVRPTTPVVAAGRYAAAACGIAILGAPFGLALTPAVEAAVHDCCAVAGGAPTPIPPRPNATTPHHLTLAPPSGHGAPGSRTSPTAA